MTDRGSAAAPAGRRPALPASVEGALFLLELAAGIGLLRLTRAPGAWRAVVPVVLSVSAAHLTVAAVDRHGLRLRGLAAGVLGVVLGASWWFAPGATWWGLPTPGAFGHLVDLLQAAGRAITAGPTPLPARPGVLLCVSGGAGMAAALTRWVAGPSRLGSPPVVAALIAPTGLFCYTALLSSGIGRIWGAGTFLGAVTLYVYAADRARARGPLRSRRVIGWRAAVMATVALAVPLAVSPALAGMRLDALPFSTTVVAGTGAGPPAAQLAPAPWPGVVSGPAGVLLPGGGDPSGSLSVLSLVDDLQAVVSHRSGQVLFVADTPVPTYWQLAALTRFDGRRWTPDPATEATASGARRRPGGTLPVLPEPAAGPLFTAGIATVGLRTTLLPVPPSTISVYGASAVGLRPGIGATSAQPTVPGLSYVAVATVPAAGTEAAASQPWPDRSVMAPYLTLPTVDSRVASLAHALVRGASGPRAEALAIAGWFRSGRFRYSLTPPAAANSLDSFLFTTRTGFCQQFAGAFGVLARVDGLPTRLAVGFTAGRRQHDGSTVVTGADAHIWPEVYLGPGAGWVSVEPTPAAGDGTGAPGILLGSRRSANSFLPGNIAGIRKAEGRPASPTPASPGPSATARPARPGGLASHSGAVLVVRAAVAGAIVAVVAVLLAVSARRRLRAVAGVLARRLRTPRDEVVSSWRRAGRRLERRQLGRAPQETLAEHAARLATAHPAAGRPYSALVELATRACYAPREPSVAEAVLARHLRAAVCAEVRRRRHRHPSATTRRRPASNSSVARSAP